MNQRDLESRIQNLVDGNLAPDERSALLAEIDRDPQLLEVYWDYVVLEGAFTRLSRSASSLQTEEAIISEDHLRGRRKRQLRWSLLATAAVLVLGAVLLRLVLVPEPPPTLSFRASPGSVMDVSHSLAGDDLPDPGTLAVGSRAILTQGTVELSFANGVRSIVQGPADLTLHDEDQLYLRSGVAWFHVPPKAVGFRVQTPEMRVTDLGTEFGVRSRPELHNEVHVFKGKVEVRTRSGVAATETLTAGMARSLGLVGRLVEIEAEPAHFLTVLPANLPHLHWSFDGDDTKQIAASGSHPAADSREGDLSAGGTAGAFATTEGKFGRALFATGAVGEATSGWTGITGNAPRTVAHWIKLSPDDLHSNVIVGWGSHNLNPFNWNPAFLTYLRQTDQGTVAGVSFGAHFLDGTTPVSDDEWHHFAVVYTGRSRPDGQPELTCYLDGQPETMVRRGSLDDYADTEGRVVIDTATPSSSQDSIPVTLLPVGWDVPRPRHIPLAIDELHIFEAALDEEQVRNLYRHNQYDYGETQ